MSKKRGTVIIEPKNTKPKIVLHAERSNDSPDVNHDSPDVNVITTEDTWKIIKEYFNYNDLMDHQIESFNDFVINRIQYIVTSLGNIKVVADVPKKGKGKDDEPKEDEKIQYEVFFKEVVIEPPKYEDTSGKQKTLYPMECIYRNITYAACIYCDLIIIPPGAKPQVYSKVYLGSFPVMVKSVLCNLNGLSEKELYRKNEDPEDKGGYFIVAPKSETSGKCSQRRIVICEERSAVNRVYVYKNRKQKPKWGIYAEVKSMKYKTFHNTVTTVGYAMASKNIKGNRTSNNLVSPNKQFFVLLPWIDTPIPLSIVFTALGVSDPNDMVKIILGPNWQQDQESVKILIPSLEYSYKLVTQEEALCYIGKKGKKFTSKNTKVEEDIDPDTVSENAISYAKYLLETEFLLHVYEYDSEARSEQAQAPVTQERAKKARSEQEQTKQEQAKQEESHSYTEFTPGIKVSYGMLKKIYFLGYITRRLLWVILGRVKEDNRDSQQNKRFITVGNLMARQFFVSFKRMINDITAKIKQSMSKNNLITIKSWIRPHIITNAMNSALSANKWSMKNNASSSVSQLYEQFNHISSLANPRKTVIPVSSEGSSNMIEPRDLHSSQYGIICACDTPEGKMVGMVKNLALTTKITLGHASDSISDILLGLSFKGTNIVTNVKTYHDTISDKNSSRYIPIFLDGALIGYTSKPKKTVSLIKSMKYDRSIDHDISVCLYRYDGRYVIDTHYDSSNSEIRINSDSGRGIRPLIRLDKKDKDFVKLKKSIDSLFKSPGGPKGPKHTEGSIYEELLSHGILEFLDKEQEETSIVAKSLDALYGEGISRLPYEYCELDPSMIFGVAASTITFPGNNPVPRDTYQSSMAKQAIGIPFLNYRQYINGKFHTLGYLQRPLCMTRSSVITKNHERPAGQNAITAILPRPFNEEDSVEFNKASLERGFMTSYAWITYVCEIREDKDELFVIPTEETCINFSGNTSNLEKDGIVGKGCKVEKGDVIIGKVSKISNTGNNSKLYLNSSIKYTEDLPGIVDLVQINTSGDGYTCVRVVVCQKRVPIVGDKFAISPSQKGTVSMIIRQEDLPFNLDGISPDVIINSLAFPSRTTISTLLEALLGKAISMTKYGDTLLSDVDFSVQKTGDEFSSRFLYSNPNNACEELKGSADSSPFRKVPISLISEELKRCGVQGFGDEVMYDGTTGEPYRALVSFGPVFYHRLKHMVIDKIHQRSRGGRSALTHQPTEGRAKGGGLKNGVMERDVMLGQGVSKVARDRLMEQSDEFRHYVCEDCGLPAVNRSMVHNTTNDPSLSHTNMVPPACKVCGSTNIVRIKTPCGSKLVVSELMAMNMATRIFTKPFQ